MWYSKIAGYILLGRYLFSHEAILLFVSRQFWATAGAAFSFFFSNSKNIFKRSMQEWGESRCNKCPNIRVVSAAVVVFVIMHWKIQLKWVGHTFQKYEVYAWWNCLVNLLKSHIFGIDKKTHSIFFFIFRFSWNLILLSNKSPGLSCHRPMHSLKKRIEKRKKLLGFL